PRLHRARGDRRFLRHGGESARRDGRRARAGVPRPSAEAAVKSYRYYDFVMAAFVTVLICSNLIGPAKAVQIELPFFGAVVFGAGVLLYFIFIVLCDVLSELYGYGLAGRVIWAGFAVLAFAALMAYVVVAPP